MDGHEIAPDIGMGDGQRTAATKLPLEKRYQRPAGADDVAETHSEETRRLRIVLPLQIESLAIKFAKPLGRAHQADRVDRLVGRDLQHGLNAIAIGRASGRERVCKYV